MRRLRNALSGPALLLPLLLAAGLVACDDDRDSDPPTSPDASRGQSAAAVADGFAEAVRAQEAHTPELLDRPGVVGTAVGVTEGGEFDVRIYVQRPEAARGLPSRLNEVPARVVVTGPFVADADETSRQRPAPVGFSVGHPDITAGTFGARVEDGSGNLYILSNNHVLANSNSASIGDPALQPGPADGGTAADSAAWLADYVTLQFGGSTNFVDAAIARTVSGNFSYQTSSEGYGTPSSTIYDLDGDGDPGTIGTVSSGLVGVGVQKYGRTTGLTTGEVAEVNVSVDVCYECSGPFCFSCSASAHFEDQIAITPGDFSGGGDSGSLIVTDDGSANPVGLLFAGSDTRTLANRIDRALNSLDVSVDDDAADDGGNSAPTADFTSSCTDLSCDFDGSGSSDSDGSIASYDWEFGDGATGTGQSVSHTYDSGGTYTVTLTVTDDDGATDTQSQDVSVSSANSAPTADFTSSCTDLSCDFDGSGSSDSDGSIASYDWEFGDGATGTGQSVSHTYDSGGTYTVTLTVTDDDGATDTQSQDVSVSSSTAAAGFHVGDLDASSTSNGRTWTATVTVAAHDSTHAAEDGSTVSFDYSGRDVSGTASCTTGSTGTCSVTVSGIRKRTGDVTFTVTGLSDADGSYSAGDNHDPDGDSDGTTITAQK